MEPDTVKSPKINKSTFKIGSGDLGIRVSNNEKKLKLLKNIFKQQRVEIGEKITPKVNILEESLINTNLILADVAKQLNKDFSDRLKTQKDLLSKERQNKLDSKRDDKENRLETKKIGKVATSIGNQIVKPFRSILDKLLDFGKLFLTGVGVNAALAWLSDPKNMIRFQSILKTLQDKPFIALGALGGALFIVKKAFFGSIKALGNFLGKLRKPKKFLKNIVPNLFRAGKKGAMKTPKKFLLDKIGAKIAKKTGLKAFGAIPGLGDIVDIGAAIYRFSKGDIAGGFLSLGSAIPFVGWGFAAIDIAREFNTPFLKGSILDKKRFDNRNKKDSRAGFSGSSVSTGKMYSVNDRPDGQVEFFQPLVPGNVISALQVERKLRSNRRRGDISSIIDLPTQDLRTNKRQIQQMQPGGSSTAGQPTYYSSIDNGNPYISEFNTMVEIGEKV